MQREKICAVLGLARTGIPTARFLAERGVGVIGYDDRAMEQLSDEARALRDIGVELRVGPGHGYARLNECTMIVLSPGLKIHHEPLRTVLAQCEARGAEVIGELELAARHCPAPIIAVTGTKGKSTTVKLIEEMLRACDINAVRCGNTGTPLIAELPNLSPQSWAVVEVSSFQLEKSPTFKPRIGVLLNLLEDHQDYHPTLEQYWTTKLKMFAHQGKGDTTVLNVDDGRVSEYSQALDKRLQPAAVTCIASSGQGSGIVGVANGALGVQHDGALLPIIDLQQIPLRGQHNHANVAAALAAVYAVLSHKLPAHVKDIAQAISGFESLPHRLEIVGTVNGVTCVNDSQATIPEAAIRALHAFEQPVTLIAGGRAKLDNADAFDELGRAVAARAHLLVTIGEAAGRIEDAARRAGFAPQKIISVGDLTKAVGAATMGTPSGGTVVLSPSCASFDQFSSFEARGEAFRRAVIDLMQGKTIEKPVEKSSQTL